MLSTLISAYSCSQHSWEDKAFYDDGDGDDDIHSA